MDVVRRAGGASVQDVMRARLSAPLGLRAAEWRAVVEDGVPGYRLWMSARDMARVGLLVASRGRWDGAPVLRDTAFLAEMLAPQAPDNAAYGYLWWLNGQASYRTPAPMAFPPQAGPLVPSAPADLVAALGRGDKKIYVSRAIWTSSSCATAPARPTTRSRWGRAASTRSSGGGFGRR